MMKAKLLLSGALFLALVLLYYPNTAARAVSEGLTLCTATVIPSLFPFLVVTALLVRLGVGEALGRVLSPFMMPLFSVSGVTAAALAAGLMGGYPSGAATVHTLYQKGELSRSEAEKALGFVNNCGPAFILSFVGEGLFLDSKVGVLLYLIHVLAALLTGLLLSRFPHPLTPPLPTARGRIATNAETLPQMVTASVMDAVSAMAKICAFVVLFRAIAAFFHLPPLFLGMLELVSGLSAIKPTREGFVIAAVLLGWGGMSVHCQTMAVIGSLSPRRYLLGKLLHMLLSLLLSFLALPLVSLP